MRSPDVRRFLVKLALLIAVLSAIVCVVVVLRIPNDFLAVYSRKVEKLRAGGSPRVILIGGSNLAFGFDSSLAERELQVNVVNTGIHAGLGLKFMLTHAISFVRSGDVLVVVPEYEIVGGGDADNGLICSLFFSDLPRSAAGFSWMEAAEIARGFPDFAFRDLVMRRIMTLVGPRATKRYEYTLAGFDHNGDEVGHLGLPAQPIRFDLRLPAQPASQIELLEDFIAAATARGAVVAFAFPPIARSVFEANREEVQEIERSLRKLEVPVLGTPADSVLADELMFDTPYHPVEIGRQINTKRLIAELIARGVVRG